ncbi:MAG TPA: S8 family serine peptidase [Gemmatimonadaceae bacterium]|nr:S8 family serine peptidase [Gemmatimonadaceae bacterium]
MRSRTLALAAGSALLAACSDPTVPVAPTRAVAAAVAPAGRYVVTFQSSDSLPTAFAADVAALGGSVESTVPGAGIASVSGLSDAAAATLAQRNYVTAVGRDFTVLALPEGSTVQSDEASLAETIDAATPEAVAESQSAPNKAVVFARQWNLRAIGADAAWAQTRLGSPNVTVAIVDGGIDYLHPDLQGRVDLSRSVSLVPSDDSIVRVRFPSRHPVTDLYFHGTAVASIVSSNATYFAGVTSRVTLMGVKVIGVDGQTPVSRVLAGIVYAADHGADVANVSLGDHYMRDSVRGAISAINRAMNYAHRKGMTVIVAAGNDGIDADHNGNEFIESCNAPNVICVSATGPTAAANANVGPWTNVDAPAPYSNYGRSMIDVAAPGGGLGGAGAAAGTLIPLPCSTSSIVYTSCQRSVGILRANGTSLAAPHVSALAALLVETLGRNPSAIRDALLTRSDDLGESGTDPYYGKGRINVPRAIGLVP